MRAMRRMFGGPWPDGVATASALAAAAGGRALHAAATSVWNSLPEAVHSSQSLAVFWKSLNMALCVDLVCLKFQEVDECLLVSFFLAIIELYMLSVCVLFASYWRKRIDKSDDMSGCCVSALLGVQLVQQIIVSREAETAKVCTRAYMVTANEKSYMLTFSLLKGDSYGNRFVNDSV